jgi:hypothetical protein
MARFNLVATDVHIAVEVEPTALWVAADILAALLALLEELQTTGARGHLIWERRAEREPRE